MISHLVLIRHGQSEWNFQNLFTGLKNPKLTPFGQQEAIKAGARLKNLGITFNSVFTSKLKRAQDTATLILKTLSQLDNPVFSDAALNERDYGILSGLNKDQARQKWGQKQIEIWRRSYDIAPPEGESLRDTVARVLPYYLNKIQPHILRGENVLVVAHGNSLRALIMALENLSPQKILTYELGTAIPIVYQINQDSTVAKNTILS